MMSPRISFSNEFLDLQLPIKLENSYREAPVSSDFEFSASNYAMISADELFFNGKLLPLRENCAKTTTLRDELLASDDDYADIASVRTAKGTSRWKQRFGLRRVVPKKCVRNMERIDEMKSSEMVFQDVFGKFIR